MAKIVLINPFCRDVKGTTSAVLIMPPLGLAYMAAVLLKHNHEVQIIDANLSGIGPERIVENFSFKPDIVGISVNIVSYKEAMKYAARIKFAYTHTPLLFGGPHCLSSAQRILEKNAAVDAVVIGEGENTLVEIVESLGKKNIFEGLKGVAYKYQNQIIHNEPRPLIENLDDIPFPAYHLLPNLKRYRSRARAKPVGYIFTSRGCPSQCTFCSRNFGTFWRTHSPHRVVEEVCYLVKQHGVRQIDILDDNFTFDINRAAEILDLLARRCPGIAINLQIGVRVDRVNEELLLKMRKAGVFKIGFGIESGDQNILKKAKKGIDLDRAIALAGVARSLGMVTHAYFIIGLPGETAKTVRKTIDFSLKMNPHYASFSICTPIPGTELFAEIKRRGQFLEDVENGIEGGLFSLKVFFKLDSMLPQEVISHCETAWKKFYMRPSKVIDVLSTVRSMGELRWLARIINDILKTKSKG